MNRWFVGIVLAGACLAGGTIFVASAAQPMPSPSPMTSASPTPASTMQP
ncbi:MAG: hypothetical protein WAK84_06740 [Candidatus Cybelea sp.]